MTAGAWPKPGTAHPVEMFGDLSDRTGEVGLDGCFRNRELVGDLPIGQFFIPVEPEYGAGAFRQPGNRLTCRLQLLARIKLVFRRRRPRAGKQLGAVHDIAGFQGCAMAPGFEMACREVAHRCEQEPFQVVFGLVRIGSPDGQEGILYDVFGLGQVSDTGMAETEKRAIVFAEKLAERGRAGELGRGGRSVGGRGTRGRWRDRDAARKPSMLKA